MRRRLYYASGWPTLLVGLLAWAAGLVALGLSARCHWELLKLGWRLWPWT